MRRGRRHPARRRLHYNDGDKHAARKDRPICINEQARSRVEDDLIAWLDAQSS